ncbi:ABC transporter permease [Chloroflexota bacterium]
MQRYIIMRLLQGVATLLVISILVFAFARLTGDPRHMLLPIEATEEDYIRVGKELGLDKPLPVQYFTFIRDLAKGDLGTSIRTRQPVIDLIGQRLPNSAKLASVAMLLGILMGLPLGVLAAVRKGKGIDSVAQVVAVLGQSMPSFWLAIMLIMLFAVHLQWFPPFGTGGISHYILPGFTMGWIAAAGITRLVRSSMLEVLDSEFVKLARIKGVSEIRVIWKHALRNALIPVVTYMGFQSAMVLSMAVVTETVFAWPGIGRLGYEGVMWRDYPVVQGVVMTIALIVVVINLAVDIIYAYIDPRVRY